MRAIRLGHALKTGAMRLPQSGCMAVIRPHADDDLTVLREAAPDLRIEVATGFAPDAAAQRAAGFEVVRAPTGGAAAALVCLPRSRAMAEALLALADRAVVPGGPVFVDGQKTWGIEPIQRALRGRGIDLGEVVTKAHGRLFSFAAGAGLTDWSARQHRIASGPAAGMQTLPGIFSADAADPGSVLLASSLPDRLGARVADLGAGWGFLGSQVIGRPGIAELTLIEAEADALDCARHNLPDPRVRFVWADALGWRPDAPFDAVVCNPPFHTSREADPALGAAFIAAGAAMLSPSGAMWLVANRHLPYEGPLGECFREVAEVAATPAYRVWHAARPRVRGR